MNVFEGTWATYTSTPVLVDFRNIADQLLFSDHVIVEVRNGSTASSDALIKPYGEQYNYHVKDGRATFIPAKATGVWVSCLTGQCEVRVRAVCS